MTPLGLSENNGICCRFLDDWYDKFSNAHGYLIKHEESRNTVGLINIHDEPLWITPWAINPDHLVLKNDREWIDIYRREETMTRVENQIDVLLLNTITFYKNAGDPIECKFNTIFNSKSIDLFIYQDKINVIRPDNSYGCVTGHMVKVVNDLINMIILLHKTLMDSGDIKLMGVM